MVVFQQLDHGISCRLPLNMLHNDGNMEFKFQRFILKRKQENPPYMVQTDISHDRVTLLLKTNKIFIFHIYFNIGFIVILDYDYALF